MFSNSGFFGCGWCEAGCWAGLSLELIICDVWHWPFLSDGCPALFQILRSFLKIYHGICRIYCGSAILVPSCASFSAYLGWPLVYVAVLAPVYPFILWNGAGSLLSLIRGSASLTISYLLATRCQLQSAYTFGVVQGVSEFGYQYPNCYIFWIFVYFSCRKHSVCPVARLYSVNGHESFTGHDYSHWKFCFCWDC